MCVFLQYPLSIFLFIIFTVVSTSLDGNCDEICSIQWRGIEIKCEVIFLARRKRRVQDLDPIRKRADGLTRPHVHMFFVYCSK